MQNIKFAVIGCGRLGTNLGIQLKAAGHTPVGLSARHMQSIQESNQWINAKIIDTCPWKVTLLADVIFITTPDDAIENTCQEITINHGLRQKAMVYHCSGSLSSDVLKSATKADHCTGSFHPLQSFPVKHLTPNPFENIYISVEGSKESTELGKILANDLKAEVTEISTDGKTLYHAAAVVASNYLVTLLEMARQLNIHAGIPDSIALKVLKPLIQGTLNNIDTQGVTNALTGPISRGDIHTIHNHVYHISRALPDFLKLYNTLGQYTIPIAKAQENISEEIAMKLLEELNIRE
jgi:predicted short-subunit dehydrogenase-like oxidoreductase (DUF2520 family)